MAKKVTQLPARQAARRLTVAKGFPAPLDAVEFPASKRRSGSTEAAEFVGALRDLRAWAEVMQPALNEIDRERAHQPGPAPEYSSEELELVFVFQRAAGLETAKATRKELAGDDGAHARSLLGLDRPREVRGGRPRRRLSGVPSEATLCRHRKRLTEVRAVELYAALLEKLTRELVSDPRMQPFLEQLMLDGTPFLSRHRAPIYKKGTKTLANPKQRITAPDAGYVPPSAGPDKAGHGYQFVSVLAANGVCLAFEVTALNESELRSAECVVNEFAASVHPYLPPEPRVLTADGAFASNELRRRLRDVGVAENIHATSHARESERLARAKDGERIPIDGYPAWVANGHRELLCVCGKASTSQSVNRDRRGKVVLRLEGRCTNCGSITITSGRWRLAQNPKRFVRCRPGEIGDLSFGNPLTFNSLLAREYGKDRFGRQEGFHGMLQSGSGIKKKGPWRRRTQVELAITITLAVQAAASLRYFREREHSGASPPTQEQLVA